VIDEGLVNNITAMSNAVLDAMEAVAPDLEAAVKAMEEASWQR